MAGRNDFIHVRGIDIELSMVFSFVWFSAIHGRFQVVFLYGCTLRKQVHATLSEIMTGQEDRFVETVELVKTLRSAAGVFKHIHTVLSDSTALAVNTQSELSTILYLLKCNCLSAVLLRWCLQ